MSNSTPFSASSDMVAYKTKIVTDTATGEIKEVTEAKNFSNGSVNYYDENGAMYTLGATEVVKEKAVAVTTGGETLSDLTSTPAPLAAVPANTGYAYAEVKDGSVIYTSDGRTPDATAGAEVGKRVSNGGRIQLRGADAIADFLVISYDGSPADLDFTYQNVEEGTVA